MSVKVLTFFALEALYFINCHSHLESHPEETFTTVVFKTLPIAYLLFLCATTKSLDGEQSRYRREVLAGLGLSLAGDVCLVWRHALFLPGAAFFALAHVFYIRAFRMRPMEYESAIIVYLSGVVVFMFFFPVLKFKSDVVVIISYLTLIFTMWWRSIVRWQRQPNFSSLLASFGALVFLVSDFCIAMDKWRQELPMAAIIFMLLYYLAQFMLTMSLYVYKPPNFDDIELREKKQG